MLGTAKDEIEKADELFKSDEYVALREQQETDFGNLGDKKFQMPQVDGAWDSVTTNAPSTLAKKLLTILSSSWCQLYIDEETSPKAKGGKKERAKISNTEQLANGCIWIADKEAIAVPSGKRLQDSLSSFAVYRGGTVKSVLWKTTDEGKAVCEMKILDPFSCQWEEDGKDLTWVSFQNYLSEWFIKRSFWQKIKDGFNFGGHDSRKRYKSYTFWDGDEWKTAINGEYIDGEEHGLGYIPVNIRTCGPVPFMQSEIYQDTMKHSWMSYAHNTRDIYDLESKLLSIESSKATESGRITTIVEYNGQQSGGKVPKFEKIGYGAGERNKLVYLDTAQGQKFVGFAEPPGNQVIDSFYNRVRTDLDIVASIDPIASGYMSRGGSGAYAAELKGATLEFLNFFRECVQEDFKWIADECVKQFTDGEFEKVSVEGRNKKREKFYVELTPKDVVKKHFECNLVPDRLRDEIQELGAAIQSVGSGLLSKETAMVKHNLVQDPDKEKDKIALEKAGEMMMLDPVYQHMQMAAFYKDQGDEEGKEQGLSNTQMVLYHTALAKIAVQETIKKAMGVDMGLAPEAPAKGNGMPPTISPQAESGQIAAEPRGIIKEAGG